MDPEKEREGRRDPNPELTERSQLMAMWSIGAMLIGVVTFIVLRVALSDEMSKNSFLGVIVLIPAVFIPVISYRKKDEKIDSNDMKLALALGIAAMILGSVGVILWDLI